MAHRSIRTAFALGILASSALVGSNTWAQSAHMGPALEALGSGDRGAAEVGFERVLHDRRALASDVAEAHRQLAGLQYASGDSASAEEHALSAVAINPAVRPPESPSEGVRVLFIRAAESQQGQRAGVEITLPEHIRAGRVIIGHLRAQHIPRSFPGRMGVRCIADGSIVAARDFEAGARAGDFSIDALTQNTNLRCVAVLASSEGVAFDRRTVNATVEARGAGAGGVILAVGGAALGVALVVTAIALLATSGSDPNLGVQLGAPRIVQ